MSEKAFEVLDNREGISSQEYQGHLVVECSVGGDFDEVEVYVSVTLRGVVPEFFSFTEYLRSLIGKKYSQEELAGKIYEDVYETLSPRMLVVKLEKAPTARAMKVTTVKISEYSTSASE